MRACLALAVGVALGVAVTRERRMPWAASWQRALAPERGPVEAALLIGRVEKRYRKLLARRPRFDDPRLAAHVEAQILPLVALYETVRDEEDGDDEREGCSPRSPNAALAAVDTCIRATSAASIYGPLLALVDRLPRAFAVFRRLTVLGTPLVTPPSGWDIVVRENSDVRLAFDVHRCFYVDLLEAVGRGELARYFCDLDDLRYGALRSIAFERTGTLARGDLLCDFRFAPRAATSEVPR